jgi:hypothetical protein
MLQTLHIKYTTFGYDLTEKVEGIKGTISSIQCLLGEMKTKGSNQPLGFDVKEIPSNLEGDE